MRIPIVLVFVGLVSCGGTVADEPSDDATASPSDAALDESGCPLHPPVAGQSCALPLPCFYFDESNGNCPSQWDCVGGSFAGRGCEGLFARDLCTAGTRCLFFDSPTQPPGACMIECAEACDCDPATRQLKCRPTPCP